MDKRDASSRPPPPGWIEALERGRADMAAGRTVPADIVIADLDAAKGRMVDFRAKKVTDTA